MKRLILALFCFSLVAWAEKRPLTHADYDGWRHIQNQKLSDDGKFLAYALFPQEGDGQLVVRNLATGQEYRESIGQLPPPPPPNPASLEEGPPPVRGIQLAFPSDSKTVVFSAFPSKGEKTKPPEKPKNDMCVMDLANGKVVRMTKVKSFQVPSKGDGFVAYLHDAGDLVLRNLQTGAERRFPGAVEFALSKDAQVLAFADAGGVYAVAVGRDEAPKPVLSEKGKYAKLTWDESQRELAFVGGGKLYLWQRDAGEPVAVSMPAGDLVVSDKGAITFSKDGQMVFFGYATKPKVATKDETPAEDRVSVDLWHWKDEHIQPMQKVQATMERNRTYRAVYHVASKKLVPLADSTMSELSTSEDGRYSIGGDDREYRPMAEYDERYADAYVIDNMTGERKLVAKKHRGRTTWSPDGKYAIFFDGADWNTVSMPEGKLTNLTGKAGVKFWREEHDSPGSPQAYGLGGWTKDGKTVLLYDHFDVWQMAADGAWAKNITQNMGRKERLMLRYVRLDEDPEDKGIDPAKPLLLRAEHEDTRDSGFYRVNLTGNGAPVKLTMAAKNFANPVKAKNADVLVLPVSTFRDAPDLYVTDASFASLNKVTDSNPQQKDILWGSAELVRYRNTDGVKLSGILYKPENFDSKKKYPMLVYIYERLTQGLNTYVEPRPGHSINVSYYVSNGYLVLEPDIAYKIGYPGQSALNCVLPAVQAVVDQGFVNENAIGIQGHSWGGYQIAYMITQTQRFKAVAAGAPVANMISAYDGIRWGPGIPRQFQYERTQSRIGGTLWEYPMRYIENSPIFMADRVKTPVMMIHNDADDAVPWYQGIEFYLGLRRLGKEVYLFTYNGEPHGLRRRPNQKDYTLRLQQYFDYELRDAAKPDWMAKGIPYLEKPGVVVGPEVEP